MASARTFPRAARELMSLRHATAIPVFAAVVLSAAAHARATSTTYARPTATAAPIDSLYDPHHAGLPGIITLDNDDVLKGQINGIHNANVRLTHPVLGSVEIPIERVASVAWLNASVPLAVAQPAELVGPPSEPLDSQEVVVVAQKPPETSPPTPLTLASEMNRQLEIGLSGSSGNSDRTTLRMGFKGRWTHERESFTLDTLYLFNVTDGNRTQNRFDLTARNEWLALPTPWRYFAEGGAELDEFRDYDARLRGGAGVGYKILESDRTDLLTRLGAGVSRTFGSPHDVVSPELILGAEFSHKLTGRQRITASADVFPSLADNDAELRAVLNAAWELKIDHAQNLTLRLGVQDRYDTATQEARKNDLEYLASLVWSF